MITAAVIAGAAMLGVAALLLLIRIERGPSMLDRVVASDVLVSVTIGALALISAVSGRVDLVPTMLVLALVGFAGSVAVARFSSVEPPSERRILSARQVRAAEAQAREHLEREQARTDDAQRLAQPEPEE